MKRLPPPEGDPDAPLKALIFDSWYDSYRGVVIVARVLEGTIRNGMKVTLMNTKQDHEVESLGVFSPKPIPVDQLGPAKSASSRAASRSWPMRRSATPSPKRRGRRRRRSRDSRN